MFTVYLIVNKLNGKTYVGKAEKGSRERWKTHLRDMKRGRITRLYSSMRKYGPENFSITEVDRTDDIKDLDRLERLWVFLMESNNPVYGYNMTDGGGGGNTRGGRKHKPESIVKMSLAATGKIVSSETRSKFSVLGKGRVGEKSNCFKQEIRTSEIVRLYREGNSTRKIAEMFGVEKTLVAGRLVSANEPLRLNTKDARKIRLIAEGKENFLDIDNKELARLYYDNHTTEEIAQMFELTHVAVRNRLIKEGVIFRPGGKRKKAA